MSIRLVATDLDGTLLRPDGTVSERTVAALRAADAAGLHVVFVTGRPIRWMTGLLEHVGRHGLAVLSNGAVVWDVAADDVRTLDAIAPETGLEVAGLIRAAVPGSAFAIEQVGGISLEPSFVDPERVPEDARYGALPDIFDAPAVKLLARHRTLAPQEFWDLARAAVGDRVVITWSSTSALLEISAQGVTKASTLARLCAELGIVAEEVLAVGDMPNDIAMLTWAGSSYAMTNAHPTVLAVAERVAPPNDEDGVAQLIEGVLADRPAR